MGVCLPCWWQQARKAAQPYLTVNLLVVLVGEPVWDLATDTENFPLIAFFPRGIKQWIAEDLPWRKVNDFIKILKLQENGLTRYQ